MTEINSEIIMKNKDLSLDERKALISLYPIFCLLSEKDIHNLATVATTKYVEAETTLTKEGDIVEKIYLISSGSAKASRIFSTVEANQKIDIATLTKNDSIGLSDSGYFSSRGLCTATVISSTPMILLSIDIIDFQHFLETSDVPYPDLKNVGEKILLMNFLDDTHLFNNFPKEMIIQIAGCVKKIRVPQATILFKQGDNADKCYFIISGTVAIFADIDNVHSEHVIKELGALTMFGEGAFVKGGKRNASARTQTDCEFFTLDREKILQMTIATDEFFAKSLSKLRIEQVRPVKVEGVEVISNSSPEGDVITLLSNPRNKKMLRLSRMDNAIWNQVDSKKTIKEISENIRDQFPSASESLVHARILEMGASGLVSLPNAEKVKIKKSIGMMKSLLKKFKRILGKKDSV